MGSVEAAATGGSHHAQLTLVGLPDHALDTLAAQLDVEARLSLSHTCRSLRQAGQRWFARVRVALSPELDCASLASWLRSHEGAEACLVLGRDSNARLLDKLTSDSSELRGLAVGELDVFRGPEMDASQLRNLTQLTSLRIQFRRLNGNTDSLSPLTALQRVDALTDLDLNSNRLKQPEGLTLLAALTQLRALDLSSNACNIPEELSALTGLTALRHSFSRTSHASMDRVLPRLGSLQHLVLKWCELTTVPKAITALTALTSLCLHGNELDEVEALAPLTALTQLRALDLAYSNCDVPVWLSTLTALTTLCLDRLRGYPLRTLPPAVSALTALEVLSLNFAVETGWQHLRPLTRLRELNLDNSDFEELPQELTVLQALETLRVAFIIIDGGWHHLLALPRLRRLTTSVEPPPAVVDHVRVIDFIDWDETESESELSDFSSGSDA